MWWINSSKNSHFLDVKDFYSINTCSQALKSIKLIKLVYSATELLFNHVHVVYSLGTDYFIIRE